MPRQTHVSLSKLQPPKSTHTLGAVIFLMSGSIVGAHGRVPLRSVEGGLY